MVMNLVLIVVAHALPVPKIVRSALGAISALAPLLVARVRTLDPVLLSLLPLAVVQHARL